MSETVLRGLAAAGGLALGRALVLREVEPERSTPPGPEAEAAALEALATVAEELAAAGARLRDAGRVAEAEILEANVLMAEDPALEADVRTLAAEKPAAVALIEASERHAAAIASLPDALLAARAADIRTLGRRAARLLSGAQAGPPAEGPSVLLASDLGPADILDLDLGSGEVCGIALARGSATGHAAIMARALGVPMAVGLGDELLAVDDGVEAILDGDAGVIVLAPAGDAWAAAEADARRRAAGREALAAMRTLPAETTDGRRVTLLCNASNAAEAAAGVDAGAEGIGLLRTELAFLESASWPGELEHARALEPVLAAMPAGVVTVRTLDFGADKTPPFLAGIAERGLALTLSHPDALADQLGGMLLAGRGRAFRILLPLVTGPKHVLAVRALLEERAAALGWEEELPPLGAMVETPDAAAVAGDIAAEADFLSIGTNDLVQYTLGLDRALPLASARAAADPAVLVHVASTVEAGHAAGRTVEVCGEAAGEPPLAVLLVGLGVDELSVSPSRLDEIRAVVRAISAEDAAAAAHAALGAGSAGEALALGEALLGELLDERGQARDGLGGVLA
jgi:phosphoenolpyruvate-protein kinase (PTS system EI component)